MALLHTTSMSLGIFLVVLKLCPVADAGVSLLNRSVHSCDTDPSLQMPSHFSVDSSQQLVGTHSEDTSWLQNVENVQTFTPAGFIWCFYQYLHNRHWVFVLLQILAPLGTAMLVCSVLMKGRKWFTHDEMYTSATQARCIHNFIDLVTNSVVGGCLFATVRCQF